MYQSLLSIGLVFISGLLTWCGSVSAQNFVVTGNWTSSGGSADIVVFKSKFYLTFPLVGSTNGWCVATSSDGSDWSECTQVMVGMGTSEQPSLAAFGSLYLGEFSIFVGPLASVGCIASSDGRTWPSGTNSFCPIGVKIPSVGVSAPSLAVFDSRLFAVIGSSAGFYLSSTTDGTTWSNPNWILPTVKSAAPRLFATSSTLYITWSLNQEMWLASSADGFTSSRQILESSASDFSPALAVHNNALYIAFKGLNNALYLASSDDGGNHWAAPSQILNNYQASASPSLLDVAGILYLTFQAPGGIINVAHST